jgi:hypothetical protein
MRRTARTAGVLYLLTFVSIPTIALYKPLSEHPRPRYVPRQDEHHEVGDQAGSQ